MNENGYWEADAEAREALDDQIVGIIHEAQNIIDEGEEVQEMVAEGNDATFETFATFSGTRVRTTSNPERL